MKPLILAGSSSLLLAVAFCAYAYSDDGIRDFAPHAQPALERRPIVVERPASEAASAGDQEPAQPAAQPAMQAWEPAGLVRIPAGATVIGQEPKAVESRVREERVDGDRAILAGEIGRRKVQIDEFWLSPTLVTNEMYLEFVLASGARPPATWAVIPKEVKERLIEENKKRDPGFVWNEAFQGKWWELNWKDPAFKWELPPERSLEPVVFVAYDEALSFCAWAGLRLPTEEELVRAGRGDGEDEYPFGKEFKREIVAHNTTLPSGLAYKRLPVAMLPNASPYGIYDLVGNVWSWTSSPYLAFDGFPRGGLKTKVKETATDDKGRSKIVEKNVTLIPYWDVARKVLKGGCFAVGPNFCRLDVRVGFDPNFAAEVVGFRVASSGKRVADAAALRARHMRTLVLGGPPEEELAPLQTLGIERRAAADMAAIEARRKPPDKPFANPTLPASYRAFGRVEVLGVVPRKDPFADDDHPDKGGIERDALKSLQFPVLGVMVTDYALADPWIPAGIYALAWMPSIEEARDILELGAHVPEGDLPKTPVEPNPDRKPGFDLSQVILQPAREHLLFVNSEGVAVGAVPLVDDLKSQQDRTIKHDLTLDMEKDALDFHLRVAGRAGKAYGLRFRVRFLDGAGQTLVRADHWNGDFAIKKLPPGAKAPLPPKPPPPRPEPAAEAAPAQAGKQ